jgi:hypothetical protein
MKSKVVNDFIGMNETRVRSAEASYWEDIPFQPPPLPLRGRVRRVLTGVICVFGMTIAKVVRVLHPERLPDVPQKFLVIRRGGLGACSW